MWNNFRRNDAFKQIEKKKCNFNARVNAYLKISHEIEARRF